MTTTGPANSLQALLSPQDTIQILHRVMIILLDQAAANHGAMTVHHRPDVLSTTETADPTVTDLRILATAVAVIQSPGADLVMDLLVVEVTAGLADVAAM